MSTSKIEALRAKLGAGANGASAPSSVSDWRSYAASATHFDVRIKGLGRDGLRFAITEVSDKGEVSVVSASGVSDNGWELSDLVVDPLKNAAKRSPIGKKVYTGGK